MCKIRFEMGLFLGINHRDVRKNHFPSVPKGLHVVSHLGQGISTQDIIGTSQVAAILYALTSLKVMNSLPLPGLDRS